VIDETMRNVGTMLITHGESGENISIPHILEEDQIKQIYRDRGAEDALDEAEENEAAEEEEDDEAEEEDEVVRAAQANRH
jgi:hypothetical protein